MQTIYILQDFTVKWTPIILLLITIHILVYVFKFFKSEKTKVALRSWYKTKIWKGIGTLIFVVVFFFLTGFLSSMFSVSMGGGVPTPMVSTAIGNANSIVPSRFPGYYANPVYNQGSSIADTRSFEKMSYSASIKTRTVEDVARKVKLLIKGVGGRIDSSNISTNYASFSFVIPKSEYDDFEDQIRTYTNAKLYSQTVSSQNKLSEKQALERNQDATKGTIASLTSEQQKVKDTYTKESKALRSQIATQAQSLKAIQSELSVATTSEKIISLQQAQANISNNLNNLNISLNNLTNKFKSDMTNLGASLTQQNSVLDDLAKATENFLDDIETVQGYISINYVTYFELFTIFSPINPVVLIGGILLILYIFGIYRSSKKEKELMSM